MNHYVYRITNKKENKHYYGVRTSKVDVLLDLGIIYFSSSSDKEFIYDQKINKHNYKYKIIKVFKNRIDAIELEIKLHNKFNVSVNDSFYNKVKQTSKGWDTTGVPSKPMYGKENGMFGRKRTDEEKRRISEGTKAGLKRINFKGHPNSEETKRKISESIKGRKFMHDPVLKILKQVKPDEIEYYLNNGFIFGKKISDPCPISIG